jgi:hypothetical protein
VNRASINSLIWGIVLIFVCTLLAATVIYIAVPDRESTVPLILALIALPTTVAGTLLTLTKVNQTNSQVEQLTNGLMDAKVRAGVADVLPEHLLDPQARDQIAIDRATRDSAN